MKKEKNQEKPRGDMRTNTTNRFNARKTEIEKDNNALKEEFSRRS